MATRLRAFAYQGLDDTYVAVKNGIPLPEGAEILTKEAYSDLCMRAANKEPYEDAISREDALLALTGNWTELTDEIIHRFIKRIKSLPPVNPQPNKEDIHREREQAYMCGYEEACKKYRKEPKTGHWIEYTRVLIPEPINKWEQAWYCSECGYGNQECEDGSAWLEWKYCPNCGAKMKKEEV